MVTSLKQKRGKVFRMYVKPKSKYKQRTKQENVRSIRSMEKLEVYWKHSNCSVRQKLIVYDSIIRTKLIYGMEGAQINDHIKKKRIDSFQLKGIRQIIKMKTTYGQQVSGEAKTNTNKKVMEEANARVQEEGSKKV